MRRDAAPCAGTAGSHAELYAGRWTTMREEVAEHLIELIAADVAEPVVEPVVAEPSPFDLPSLPEPPRDRPERRS